MKLTKNLLLVFVSLAFILVIVEMALHIPTLYVHLIKNPHRNTDYFRDEEFKKKKEKNTFRIFLIGDSFVFSGGVNRHEMIDRLLEERLNQNSSGRYEVFNLGRNGASPKGYYLFAKQFKDYQPDFIIVSFYVDNDVMTADLEGVPEERGLYTLKLAQLLKKIPDLLSRFGIYRHSESLDCMKIKGFNIEEQYKEMACQSKLNAALIVRGVREGDESRYYQKMARQFKEIPLTTKYLLKLRELFPKTPMLLVIQPEKFQVSRKYLEDLKLLGFQFDRDQLVGRELQDELIAWAQSHGMDTLDMLPIFSNHEEKTLYLPLDDHYSSEGYAVVAEALYQKIKKNLHSRLPFAPINRTP